MNDVLIVGAPNSGKSLLFNRLTGLHQKVANFPGVTVEVRTGQTKGDHQLQLVDFPGVYSIHTLTRDEDVAIRVLRERLAQSTVSRVLIILDATRLERSLLFALQIREMVLDAKKSFVIAANMWDEVESHQLRVDLAGLGRELGCEILPISAKSGRGLDELENALRGPINPQVPVLEQGQTLHSAKSTLATLMPVTSISETLRRWSATELGPIAHRLAKTYGPQGSFVLRSQYRWDQWLLTSSFGFVFFLLLMGILFQSIFSWSAPFMDAIEGGLGALAEKVVPLLPEGFWQSFVNDALFAGVAGFLVFVPQIFVLTFIVGLMEDSGYLARAAVLVHRPLRWFGLTGKSFVPMLSGYACAIPGIYAARNIESPKRRMLTYFAVPLMSCSARLPVYALLIAAVIPDQTIMGGLFGLRGAMFALIYLLGLLVALVVTGMLSKTAFREVGDAPFVLEIPPYRKPNVFTILRQCWSRSGHFITKAGPIIFMVSLTVWVLGYFPNSGTDLGSSYLGLMGQWIEPLMKHLGLDWMYGVAILASFLAREVFVGTLGTLMGIEGADEDVMGLAERLAASGLTLASGIALLVFYAVALQCVSTVAIIKKELGSWKVPGLMVLVYAVLAYGLAWLSYLIFL